MKREMDELLVNYDYLFPEDWDDIEIAGWCIRYVISNIEDVKEFFLEEVD